MLIELARHFFDENRYNGYLTMLIAIISSYHRLLHDNEHQTHV